MTVKFNCVLSPLPINRVHIALHAAKTQPPCYLDQRIGAVKDPWWRHWDFFFLCVVINVGNNPRRHCKQRLWSTVEYLSPRGKFIVSVIIVVSDLTAVTSFSCDAADLAATCNHAIRADAAVQSSMQPSRDSHFCFNSAGWLPWLLCWNDSSSVPPRDRPSLQIKQLAASSSHNVDWCS